MKTTHQSPEQVLQSHLQAIGTGNFDLLMQDFTEESIFITPSGIHTGLAQIRAEYERLLAVFPPGSTFNMVQQNIYENYILVVWSGASDFVQIPFATDTFVIKNNKIVLQTFAGQMLPKDA